jgi:hypothetical protein
LGVWGENALTTCGCVGGQYTGERKELWSQVPVNGDDRFDFEIAHVLRSDWCERHGKAFCKSIVEYDHEKEARRTRPT